MSSYATLASPSFTGTLAANVINVSTDLSCGTLTCESIYGGVIQQLKTNILSSPTFTGTVLGITKAMVGLDNVDNTTDALKPVSTATTTQLNLKAPIASPSFTGTAIAQILTTGKLIASTGTRESGLQQTGIIAMNTGGQEIFWTDNTRNINFRGNVVIDAICAPNSIECTNTATFNGPATFNSSSTVVGTGPNSTHTIKKQHIK